MSKIKKRKQVDIINNMIWAYPDLVQCYGVFYKQLDLRYGYERVIPPVVTGNPAVETLCNDIIEVYNGAVGNECEDIYATSFRSNDSRDCKKYYSYIYKDFIKMVQSKHDHNVDLNHMEVRDIVDGLGLFVKQLK